MSASTENFQIVLNTIQFCQLRILYLLMQSLYLLIQENWSRLPSKIWLPVTQVTFYFLLFYKTAFTSVTC